jgi:hypothetical protein
MSSTPRTAAGQRLVSGIAVDDPIKDLPGFIRHICLVEAEAAAAEKTKCDEGHETVWHYCDFDSEHHREAEAAAEAEGLLAALVGDDHDGPCYWGCRRQYDPHLGYGSHDAECPWEKARAYLERHG